MKALADEKRGNPLFSAQTPKHPNTQTNTVGTKFVDRFLYFYFWPLCCLFVDIRILITHLVSSNSSFDTFYFQIFAKTRGSFLVACITI